MKQVMLWLLLGSILGHKVWGYPVADNIRVERVEGSSGSWYVTWSWINIPGLGNGFISLYSWDCGFGIRRPDNIFYIPPESDTHNYSGTLEKCANALSKSWTSYIITTPPDGMMCIGARSFPDVSGRTPHWYDTSGPDNTCKIIPPVSASCSLIDDNLHYDYGTVARDDTSLVSTRDISVQCDVASSLTLTMSADTNFVRDESGNAVGTFRLDYGGTPISSGQGVTIPVAAGTHSLRIGNTTTASASEWPTGALNGNGVLIASWQ